ncbi:MAG TPA: TIGR03435 family protein [Candidatus Solibacter sp.]|nr:TIGR03435 family protein [Candidatus Solibacter sp.]
MQYLAVLFCASIAYAQIAFEITSVRPSPPDQPGMSMHETPGRVILQNATLGWAIKLAYHLQDYQLSGGPKWLDSDHYDIEGKGVPATANYKQKLVMLQALLADRFQLKFRRDKREVSGYVLLPAKGGIKVAKSAATDEKSSSSSGTNMVSGKNETAAGLAAMLSDALGRPVLDETGFTDRFDFKLNWAPVNGEASASVFSLLQEQLGMRLEARKVPVDVLVIEGAEKPAAN